MLQLQAGNTRLRVEVRDGIPTIQTEPHDEQTIVPQVCGDPPEHFALGAWSQEGHHIAGTHCRVEPFRLTLSGQVKFGQVSDEPDRAGMIGFGCLDQLPIGVDTDHDMSTGGESGAHPPRPAAGIQHTRPAREHRI